ncbi:MAG TPA: dTMP kinase [Candidatus Bathyarchaeia archaeon]|nr:dTMP kinase [Candidatus Bathyarchaeia archaeon]
MSEMGKYVVIEGHDGTGKTTQVPKIRDRLAAHGIASIEIHEPAKDPTKDGIKDEVEIADAIRALIKNGSLERDGITNLFLFNVARHETWRQKAMPALKMDKWVVSARNYYSTLAYQGYGEGIDLDLIYSQVATATDQQYMNPDIAILLDLDDEEERLRRIENRGPLENPDTFESKSGDFQARVKNAYLDIAKKHNASIISAVGTQAEVTDRIWAVVEPHTC